jgi:hypothetical protein
MCRPHRSRPLVHQVHNAGAAAMRLIGAEIKASPAVMTAEPLVATGHQLTLERDRLRVYELALDPGESTGAIEYEFSSLTVFLTIATLLGSDRTTVHAPGDAVWLPGPAALSITNVGEERCRAAVGEWR